MPLGILVVNRAEFVGPALARVSEQQQLARVSRYRGFDGNIWPFSSGPGSAAIVTSKVLARWRSCKAVARRPCRREDIHSFEHRTRLRLPSDLRELLLSANGIETDGNGFDSPSGRSSATIRLTTRSRAALPACLAFQTQRTTTSFVITWIGPGHTPSSSLALAAGEGKATSCLWVCSMSHRSRGPFRNS